MSEGCGETETCSVTLSSALELEGKISTARVSASTLEDSEGVDSVELSLSLHTFDSSESNHSSNLK